MKHLEIDDLSVSYGETQVLTDVSFQATEGSISAIVGASGSGKTTLLRLVAGFMSPDHGTISIGGVTVAGAGRNVPAHRRNVGYVAQDGALFPHLTVAQNVAFGLKGSARRVRDKVDELLETVSLDVSFASRRPDELSGGQQQRVALARALAREPQLMLLDEPFSALDTRLRMATRKSVAAILKKAGVTTVLVTHDQGEALSFADQVTVMRAGHIVQTGEPYAVYTCPADRETAEFLGEAVILDAVLDGQEATCCLGRVPLRAAMLPSGELSEFVARPANGAGSDDGLQAAQAAPADCRPSCSVADCPISRTQIMLRPEQIRIAEDGGIRGRVLDSDYFGSETTVRVQLESPAIGAPRIITIRHWNAERAKPGSELCLRVVGEAVALPHVHA